MKFMFIVLSLFVLVSCNSSDSKSNETTNSEPIEETAQFILPKIGFQKTFNLNYRLEWLYEIITVNPNGNGTVLGDRPFYVEAHEGNEIKISFYNSQDLKSVKFINYGSTYESFLLSGVIDQIPYDKRLKEVQDFTREFTYGIHNVESPVQDMANKVFIIETEESEHPYKSTMKLAFWLSCRESLQKGVCPETKLKFNYKLLDYTLNKE